MIARPDLLDAASAPGIEVLQLTTETSVPSSHIYMEAQIFTPDSRGLVVHRSAHPHGSDMYDPEHRYLLCDLHDGGKLLPLTDELGTTGPSISPDGQWFYYFVNETKVGAPGRLTLKRRRLDGSRPEVIVAVAGKLPGTPYYPSRIYPLSTISADGQRLAISCYLGDGKNLGAPWGLLVFDVAAATVHLALQGISWCNLHPQYCRSRHPQRVHDLLAQENHANIVNTEGNFTRLVGGLGADIHVVRDDGQCFRDLPWGRDNDEYCQGHQCWRGQSSWAITSNYRKSTGECQLIEGAPVAAQDHDGAKTPGGRRNDLSRGFGKKPLFYHFATDYEGRRLVTDCGPSSAEEGSVWIGDLGEPGTGAISNWTYLCRPRSQMNKTSHLHPFLSPDGRWAFFNSDESGRLQAYAIRGLSAPSGVAAGKE